LLTCVINGDEQFLKGGDDMKFRTFFLSITAAMAVAVLMSGCSSACASLDCSSCDSATTTTACRLVVDADDEDVCQAALDNAGFDSCE